MVIILRLIIKPHLCGHQATALNAQLRSRSDEPFKRAHGMIAYRDQAEVKARGIIRTQIRPCAKMSPLRRPEHPTLSCYGANVHGNSIPHKL